MRLILAAAVWLTCACAPVLAQVDVAIAYLKQEVEAPPTLSNLDPIPDDDGVAGARVAIEDNATTGRFLGHHYALNVTSVPVGGDLRAAAQEVLGASQLVVLDMAPEAMQAVADLPAASGAILINATSGDGGLRGAGCRANLLHAYPSDAMRADALAQVLLGKRWPNVALITGPAAPDLAFADALRGAIAKFQLNLRSDKAWDTRADIRRNASQEVGLFTQDLKAHDVLIVADEIGDFARYIPYNTWTPRPVAGSEGLRPVAWAPVVEQWGAAQLQSRFAEATGRDMRPHDYGAWAAVRAIGEAVTRTGSADPATLRAYMLSDAFELGGFKGRPMSFRPWNGQLRQPIPVVTDRAVVATAPLDGFLHQRSELDTLGLDAPESACRAFEGT